MDRRPFSCILVLLVVLVGATPAWAGPVSLRGHDARGAAFDLSRMRGQVVVVSFASRYTQKESALVNREMGARARPAQVAVVSIVDFVGIPRLFHNFARGRVAQHDEPQRTKLLVDEQSVLSRQLGADPAHRVDILIIDPEGALRARFRGPQQIADAIRMVEALRTQSVAEGHAAVAMRRAPQP